MSIAKIKLDKDKFDKCQVEMVTAIVSTIVGELRNANLPDDESKDLATTIAFQVCCILDASAPIGEESDDIFPVLTFQAEGYADDEVISCGGASYMHEYVHGLVKEWFQPKPKPGSDV